MENVSGEVKLLIPKLGAISYPEWHIMGYILCELGKKDDAIRCYDKALGLNPNYFISWHNKGLIYENLGQLADAEKCYANALNINPKVALDMGDNLYKQEKYEKALEWLQIDTC